MNNKNNFLIILGILTLMVAVAGATYAWITWNSSETIISGKSGCFDILYDKGANASVTISVDSGCSASGKASINLNTNSFLLYDGVTDAFTAGIDVLAYQVVIVNDEVETSIDGCSGHINSGGTISLCEVELNNTPTTYKVYLYLDCNTTTTDFIGATYKGNIQSVAYMDVD